MDVAQDRDLGLDEGLVDFTVVDRNEEPVGEVARVSLDGACLLVATRKGLLGRSKEHAIHHNAITDIDLDAQTVTIAGTRDHVEQAPEYSNLDPHGSDKIAHHYNQAA